MRDRLWQSWTFIFGLVLLPGLLGGSEVVFDRYHSYDELSGALKEIAAKHKEVVRLQSIGRSGQGRELWLVRVAGSKGTDPDRRSAVLIVANLEGSHLIGTEMALYTVHYLATNYSSNDTLQILLNRRTFYVLPCVNPDGMHAFFAGPLWARVTNATPRDEDFDDVADEDGPEDLNGDGLITLMRVKAADGEYLPNPKEPRLLKRADKAKGERGEYKLYTEGLDNDGDEQFNEDGPGGVNLNMNFPHAYPERATGAGLHALSEPESRGLVDFCLAHRNIAVIVVYGTYDNLLTPPQERAGGEGEQEPDLTQMAGRRGSDFPTGMSREQMRRMFERKAPTAVLNQDVPFYQEVSKRYRELVGIAEDRAKDKPRARGAFYEWAYFQYGVPSFAAKVWTLPEVRVRQGGDTIRRQARAPEGRRAAAVTPRTRERDTEESDEALWLKRVDREQQGKGFVPWTRASHPTLGEVEVGGLEPLLKVNPPAAQIAELGMKHAGFATYLAGLCPELALDNVEVKPYGGGVFRVKVEVENRG